MPNWKKTPASYTNGTGFSFRVCLSQYRPLHSLKVEKLFKKWRCLKYFSSHCIYQPISEVVSNYQKWYFGGIFHYHRTYYYQHCLLMWCCGKLQSCLLRLALNWTKFPHWGGKGNIILFLINSVVWNKPDKDRKTNHYHHIINSGCR